MIRYLQLLPTNLFAALEALTALTMEDEPVDVYSTPPQLDGDLVTLTLLPRSRWQALLNLEVIQVCAIDHANCGKVVLKSLERSNEINPRNLLKSPNKHPSSFQLCLVSNTGLELTRNKPKVRKRPDSTKLWQPPKVYSIKNLQNYRKRAGVGIAHIPISSVLTTFLS